MPRNARKKSASGIYHIMLRGINRQHIFEDNEDNSKFLYIISDCKAISEFQLYGYCLMGNHIHLLIKEGKEGLDLIFKRIGARYVYWYNRKYKRCGHLFQDRFKSEPVDSDRYFTVVLRYIHQNPVVAGLCDCIANYKWSSYSDYINRTGIVDYDFVFGIIGKNNFESFMNEVRNEECIEINSPGNYLSDVEAIKKIEETIKVKVNMIQSEAKKQRDILLASALKINGISIRQLARVTGITTNMIWRISNR